MRNEEVTLLSKATSIREVSVEEAKTEFDTLIDSVRRRKTSFILKQAGQAIARIVPSDPREESRREFFAEAKALRRSFADLSARELEQLIDRAVVEVRSHRKKVARA